MRWFVTSYTVDVINNDTTMSQLSKTSRRPRQLAVALMTCALLLGAYRLWTSTSSPVVEYPLNDFGQSPVNWRSSRVNRHNTGGLSGPKLTAKSERKTISGDKQTDNQTMPLLGISASGAPKHKSVSETSLQPSSLRLSRLIQRARPVMQKHIELDDITRSEHVDHGIPATADDTNFLRYKNSRRKNQWELQEAHAAETGLLSDKYLLYSHASRRESQPRTSAASANISHSVAMNIATPKPIYLVVPNDDKDTESVDDFKDPDVVIRSADADMPRNERVSGNASGVSSEYGPGGRKRSPLLGALRGGPGNCRVYSARDELPELVDFAAGVDCLDLATTPTVVVCPYPDADDGRLSLPLRTHGVWEPHVVQLFQAALLTDNELGVYDIGANIGQYALLAAAMGRRVVAVELHRPNIYRLHKAIRLGRLEDKVSVCTLFIDSFAFLLQPI